MMRNLTNTDKSLRGLLEASQSYMRMLSMEELAVLGISQIAYVRVAEANAEAAFSIHAADGSMIGEVSDMTLALATIRDNDLVAVSVH